MSEEPVMKSWTREELQEHAKNWMKANAEGYTREGYYGNLGLLIDFVTDLFDGVNVDSPNIGDVGRAGDAHKEQTQP